MLSDETRDEIERRAIEIAASIEAKAGPYLAEIAGERAAWHIVETAPGAERKAVRSLADRGFGVFLPEFAGDAMRLRYYGKTIAIGGTRLIFPGHVFLFVWGVEANWRRVLECPGVRGIVQRADRPIVVPDAVIDHLQALQFGTMPRRGRRPSRRTRHQGDAPGELLITVSTRSFWREISASDAEGRIGLWHRALGLATITAGTPAADSTVAG